MNDTEAVRSVQVWRSIALFSLLGLTVFAGYTFLPTRICPVPDNLLTDEQLKLIKLADAIRALEKPNCFDFWFNRYQTFAAAIIAFATAVVATRPAISQLKEMRRQSDQRTFEFLEARYNNLGKIGRTLIDTFTAVRSVVSLVSDLNSSRAHHDISKDVADLRAAITQIHSMLADLAAQSQDLWEVQEAAEERSEIFGKLFNIYNISDSVCRRIERIGSEAMKLNSFGVRRPAMHEELAEIAVASNDLNNIYKIYAERLDKQRRAIHKDMIIIHNRSILRS